MVGRMADAVCGPQGPNLILASKDKNWAREAAAKFWKWANNVGPDKFDALNRQTLMETVRSAPVSFQIDGDFACVYFTDGTVRMVEAAEIVTPPKQIANGKKIVSGVEYDGNGAPVALWVANTPPGGDYSVRDHRRIEWDKLTLLRNPGHRRMNQTRGEPGLAATVRYMELIDDGIDATILAYRAAVYTALVAKVADPSQFTNSAIAQTAALDGASNPAASGSPQELAWEPMGIMTIGKDEDITAIKPEHPSTAFEPFMKSLVRWVGSDPGVPLELTMLDASQTNYHGFKSAVGNAYRHFAWIQYQLSEWLTTLATWRIAMWIQSGELTAPEDWDAIEWRFAGPPIIDAKEEYEAVSLAFSQRFKSRAQCLQDIGYTGPVEDLDNQIQSELKDMRDKGIEPVAMPGSPSATPAESTTNK
jgi:capsid protein